MKYTTRKEITTMTTTNDTARKAKVVNELAAVVLEETMIEGTCDELAPVAKRLTTEWRSRGEAAFEGVELHKLADIAIGCEVAAEAVADQFREVALEVQDLGEAINAYIARVDG
jgi:hypothetical protein